MRAFEGHESRRIGWDKFGPFRITGGPCTNCESVGVMCVTYRHKQLELPAGVKPEDTILRDPRDTYLGINCGCYAKLHRQVAHIVDKISAKN